MDALRGCFSGGYVFRGSSALESHACNCMGPRPGDPVCPCMMPAHREREAGKRALELMRWATTKPRFRVKAGRREVTA